MNSIIPFSSTPASMSSREIAELANSRHDSVKRTIERLAERDVIDLPPLVEYLDPLGRPAKEYVFSGEKGKRDSIIVVAQMCPEFTARLVDRWQELEAQAANPLPAAGTFAATLRLMADELESMNQRIDQRLSEQDQRIRRVERENSQLRAMGIRRLAALAVNPNQIGLDLEPPAKPRGESQGGTHASPRPHYRRAHYRTLPNGERVEVKAHSVNKNKKGETLQ